MKKNLEVYVFWVVMPCTVVVGCHRFFTLKMEAGRFSEKFIFFRNNTRHHNPENLDLNLRRLENLKSRIMDLQIPESE
jgi:hypothetical protein